MKLFRRINLICLNIDIPRVAAGQLEDLDNAISILRAALELRPAPHPDRAVSLYNLAGSLRAKFQHSGYHNDLDDAINAFYESLQVYVSGHPATCQIAADLGSTLMDAYSYTNESEYLE
jgi:hypothetical protein